MVRLMDNSFMWFTVSSHSARQGKYSYLPLATYSIPTTETIHSPDNCKSEAGHQISRPSFAEGPDTTHDKTMLSRDFLGHVTRCFVGRLLLRLQPQTNSVVHTDGDALGELNVDR
jgi:hypothetical protein